VLEMATVLVVMLKKVVEIRALRDTGYENVLHVIAVVWSCPLPAAAALLWNDGNHQDPSCWLSHTSSLCWLRGAISDISERSRSATSGELSCSSIENM